jgi:hypothetical protein
VKILSDDQIIGISFQSAAQHGVLAWAAQRYFGPLSLTTHSCSSCATIIGSPRRSNLRFVADLQSSQHFLKSSRIFILGFLCVQSRPIEPALA